MRFGVNILKILDNIDNDISYYFLRTLNNFF